MKVQTKQPNVTQQQANPGSLPWQPPAPSTSSTSSLPASYSNGQSKVAAWLQESEEMDKCAEGQCLQFTHSDASRRGEFSLFSTVNLYLDSFFFAELARCQSNLTELSRLLQSLEILQRTQSAPNFTEMQVEPLRSCLCSDRNAHMDTQSCLQWQGSVSCAAVSPHWRCTDTTFVQN